MSPVVWAIWCAAAGLILMGALVFSTRGPDRAKAYARLRILAESGSVISQDPCGGRVGWLYVNSFDLQAAVYPGGLVVDGFLLGMRVILASEIRCVRWRGTSLFGGLQIEHDGIGCRSPVLLRTGRKSELAAAIFQIADGKAA